MRTWIRRALTKTLKVKGPRGSTRNIEVHPSERLVYGVYFSIIALVSLAGLQIAHLVVIGQWSDEVFAAITLVIGTILGAFFGRKSE